MRNLDLLKRQHEDMRHIVARLKSLLSNGIETHADEIALQLNTLSGKLKMHLLSEDRFLYPSFMKSEHEAARKTAEAFNREMGNLAEVFHAFVQKYNTPLKVVQGKGAIKVESGPVFQAIESRIQRENESLYPLAEV